PHIIIFKFINPSEISFPPTRNPGPFWEAGAFAGFLVIAIVFNCFISGSLFRNKENKIFIIALLTTMSTTGYIAFFIFSLAWIIYKENSDKKLFILPVAFVVVVILFSRLEFLQDKITTQISNVDPDDFTTQKRSRFVSALVDLEDIRKNPLLGKGKNKFTRFEGYYEDEVLSHRNNSFTGYAQKFGLIAWFIYFFFTFKSFIKMSYFYKIPKNIGVASFLVLCVLSFSQDFLYKPFFYTFLFFHLIYNLPYARKTHNNYSYLQ
ncbi:MAG: O-antigen ligase family protein, partial [Bacteroidales bacterium]|nr:O-antigen ligase family protein [Bacteroidales bacterium]